MYLNESDRRLAALHEELHHDLQPVGCLEEVLVDQIVTILWRTHRVLKAESAEIALSVDNSTWQRRVSQKLPGRAWAVAEDPEQAMSESGFGNHWMIVQLRIVRDSVEKDGELTDATIKEVECDGRPYGLTMLLHGVRKLSRANLEGLDPKAARARQKEQALNWLDFKLAQLNTEKTQCILREDKLEKAQQAAAVLPPSDVLDKIINYEGKLKRQLYRALNQLERLQRLRRGEPVPPPLTMGLDGRD